MQHCDWSARPAAANERPRYKPVYVCTDWTRGGSAGDGILNCRQHANNVPGLSSKVTETGTQHSGSSENQEDRKDGQL